MHMYLDRTYRCWGQKGEGFPFFVLFLSQQPHQVAVGVGRDRKRDGKAVAKGCICLLSHAAFCLRSRDRNRNRNRNSSSALLGLCRSFTARLKLSGAGLIPDLLHPASGATQQDS